MNMKTMVTRIVLCATLFFAALEVASASSDIQTLYETKLKPAYEQLAPLHHEAKKRTMLYIALAIAAVVLFALAVKFMQLRGALVMALLISVGIYTLRQDAGVRTRYHQHFAQKILSPIAQETIGCTYAPGHIDVETVRASHLFSPSTQIFRAEDLFRCPGASFGYLHLDFNTKENAAVERFDENIFDGIMIVIDSPSPKEGVVISRALKEKVALQNFTMNQFFADAHRAGEKGNFSLFGTVDEKMLQSAAPFANLPVGISWTRTHRYIVLYTGENPFGVDELKPFDLERARAYRKSFEEIGKLIAAFR